jgi:hypothetical protein
MNCPRCQRELPENFSADSCPNCGENIGVSAVVASLDDTAKRRISLLWIFLILAAPAILDFMLVSFFQNSDGGEGLMVCATFAGTPLAGIIGAILLVRRQREGSDSPSILRVFLLFILLTVVSFALCFVGCAVGSAFTAR